MRMRTCASVLLLLAGVPLLAEDADATVRLPFNPWADAAEGDWATYDALVPQEGTLGVKSVITWNVTKAEADRVTVAVDGKESTWSRKDPPLLSEYVHLRGLQVKGQTNDEWPMGEKVFHCRRMDFLRVPGPTSHELVYSVYVSPEVKASGMVFFDLGDGRDGRKYHYTLAGYGTKEKTLWGVGPDELEKGREGWPEDEEQNARLPVNPFAHAKEGDWAVSVVVVTKGGKETSRGLITWEVLKVEGAKVTVRTEGGERTFRADEAQTIEQGFAGPGVHRVRLGKEERTIGGRAFACRTVKCLCNGTDEAEAWISEEVTACGIVRMRSTSPGGEVEEADLLGFGTREGTTWGLTIEEAEKKYGTSGK